MNGEPKTPNSGASVSYPVTPLTASQLLAQFNPSKTVRRPKAYSNGILSPPSTPSPVRNSNSLLRRHTLLAHKFSRPKSSEDSINSGFHRAPNTVETIDLTNISEDESPPGYGAYQKIKYSKGKTTSRTVIDLDSSSDDAEFKPELQEQASHKILKITGASDNAIYLDIPRDTNGEIGAAQAAEHPHAGRVLRPRQNISLSLKAKENVAQGHEPSSVKPKPIDKKKRVGAPRILNSDQNTNGSYVGNLQQRSTAFTKSFITESEIFEKQCVFIKANKKLFLPLLVDENPVSQSINGFNIDELPEEGNLKYNALDIANKSNVLKKPAGINVDLMLHQLHGLSWLVNLRENGTGGILGDMMGLGKTLQILSLLQYVKETSPNTRTSPNPTSLVICPKSVLGTWEEQAGRFSRDLAILKISGQSPQREEAKALLRRSGKQALKDGSQAGYDVVLTTYETVQMEKAYFQRATRWEYVVLDEGHRLKNDTSILYRAITSIKSRYRVILTGTPLQNNMVELWALLHYLFPHLFERRTRTLFESAFDLTKGRVRESFIDHSSQLLNLIMLRRNHSSPEVKLNLPGKTEIQLYVPLSSLQRKCYLAILKNYTGTETVFGDLRNSTTKEPASSEGVDTVGQREHPNTWRALMNLVMSLRKVCVHPYLLTGIEPEPYVLGAHVWQTSGKFAILRNLIEHHVLGCKNKVLIFSGFLGVLDLCEDLIGLIREGESKIKFARIDGSTESARRNLEMRLFQELTEYKIMLLSTRTGGLGINLTAANIVVFLDEDWNPQITLQAEARAHRFGQTKSVTIYKIYAAGSVEQQMLSRLDKKLYLSSRVGECMVATRAGSRDAPDRTVQEDNDPSAPFSVSQLKRFVRRGTKVLTYSEEMANEMIAWDFEKMVKEFRINSSGETAGSDDLENELKNDQDWFDAIERVKCADFEGRHYEKKEKKHESIPANEVVAKEDRRRGKHTTVMIDGYAVAKSSLLCKNGEAVPTMADPDSKADKKQRRIVHHQESCCKCGQGGLMEHCMSCPRAIHRLCFENSTWDRVLRQYRCSQHRCYGCGSNTAQANGLLLRCMSCIKAYCEDCIDWKNSKLIADNLDEFEALGHSTDREFYIKCPDCNIGVESKEIQIYESTSNNEILDSFSLKKSFCGSKVFEEKGHLTPSTLKRKFRE